MTWAQRLKRVFKIDIETCSHCGRVVKIIACIENAATSEHRGYFGKKNPSVISVSFLFASLRSELRLNEITRGNPAAGFDTKYC